MNKAGFAVQGLSGERIADRIKPIWEGDATFVVLAVILIALILLQLTSPVGVGFVNVDGVLHLCGLPSPLVLPFLIQKDRRGRSNY